MTILYRYPPQSVSVSVPPVEFMLNGVETSVSRDTATPSNSRPLPTISLDGNGDVATPLTDTQLRASPVPVSGPLTDTQLRATAVPVSGPLTDSELRATAVPVSASSLPLPTGASTLAEQQEQSTRIGPVNEAAASTDTIPSGLNGRLQRIAQRLTSLIALFPATLGQTTKAGSLSVTLASDQDTLPVSGPLTDAQLRATAVPVSGPLTDSQLRASAISVTQTALAPTFQEDSTVSTTPETFTAPAGAKSCVIQAPSSNTINLRVRIGGVAASTTSGYVFEPGRSEVFPFAGDISYCSESGSGQAINVHFGT